MTVVLFLLVCALKKIKFVKKDLCRQSDLCVKCTIKLKCTPKAVTCKQYWFSQKVNIARLCQTGFPPGEKQILSLRIHILIYNYYHLFWTSRIIPS